LESIAHVAVQQEMERKLEAEPEMNIAGPEFLSHIHREFYLKAPEEFLVVRDIAQERESRVSPGELRKEEVRVGTHVPPEHETLPAFLRRFAEWNSKTELLEGYMPESIIIARSG
jgi:hypothetical protein